MNSAHVFLVVLALIFILFTGYVVHLKDQAANAENCISEVVGRPEGTCKL